MPWKETSVMEERVKLIADCLSEQYSVSDLCRGYGISRTTAYKWIRRYAKEGVDGLKDRSRAPHRQAHAVEKKIEDLVVDYRRKHPGAGPKKIRVRLAKEHAEIEKWPAVSTMGEILKRHNLVVSRKRKKPRGCPSEHPLTEGKRSNDVWCMDFKGEFQTGDRKVCYPLTLSDFYSRFFLGCQGMERTDGQSVRAIVERIFREFGLPEVIRTDNGPPFASVGLGGLTRLSIWWIKLGIVPERIEPGKPQQNGRHERLHRTLKSATLDPPAATMRKQQEVFDRFIEEYNWERPHEALGQIPPGDLYEPSLRPYPGKVREMEYGEDRQVRYVKRSGEISWNNRHWYLSEALGGERVGLEEIEGPYWQISFGDLILGKLDMNKKVVVREPYLRRRDGGEACLETEEKGNGGR